MGKIFEIVDGQPNQGKYKIVHVANNHLNVLDTEYETPGKPINILEVFKLLLHNRAKVEGDRKKFAADLRDASDQIADLDLDRLTNLQ